MKRSLALLAAIGCVSILIASCATQKATRIKTVYTAYHSAAPDTLIWDNGDTVVVPKR